MKRKQLFLTVTTLLVCLTLTAMFTSCGDDDSKTDDSQSWICGKWDVSVDVTNYENNKVVEHRTDRKGTAKFERNGTLSGFEDFTKWKLTANTLTVSGSRGNVSEKTFNISKDANYQIFTFTEEIETLKTNDSTSANGKIEKKCIKVYVFRKDYTYSSNKQ